MNNYKLRILLAEKDAITAVDTVNIITDLGFNITSVVDTALDAITKTEIDRPDLILMDVSLRGSLNGVEAANIISFKYNIPIVFIASLKLLQIFSRDHAFRFRECIIKPVSPKSILAAVNKSMKTTKAQFNQNMINSKTFPSTGAVI